MNEELNFEEICRVCLSKIDPKEMHSIDHSTMIQNNENNICESICEMIQVCTSVHINKDENLPDKICKACMSALIVAYKFKTLCENSDRKLRKCLGNIIENKLIGGDLIQNTNSEYVEKYSVDESVELCNSSETIFVEVDQLEITPLGNSLYEKNGWKSDESISEKACENKFQTTNESSYTRWSTNERPFLCSDCGYRFKRATDLTRHSRVHTGETPYVCRTCHKGFKQKFHLSEHERSHADTRSFSCKICSKAFTRYGTLRTHMRTHSSLKLYSCTICNKRFSGSDVLKRHRSTHSCIETYSCSKCLLRFNNYLQLQAHACNEDSSKKTSQNQKLKISGSLKKSERNGDGSTEKKKHICSVCMKSFNYSHSLKKHLLIHTGERPFQCSFCDKTFKQSSHLETHVRLHTGNKPFKCNLCEKAFEASSRLIVHRRSHTGEKPYSCKTCMRTFSTSTALKIHTRIHTGETPYSCLTCSRKFSRSDLLTIHRRTYQH